MSGAMVGTKEDRRSSAAALSEMRASNDSLQEKFGRLCRQTGRSEYQEKYKHREFDVIKSKKYIQSSNKKNKSVEKKTIRKTKKAIEAGLLPTPPLVLEDKENKDTSNSYEDAISDAPTACTYMSSVLQSGTSTTLNSNSIAEDDDQELKGPDTLKLSSDDEQVLYDSRGRISESKAKYIKWPIEEHVPHHGPLNHDFFSNPNAASSSSNWQSVMQAEMQATVSQLHVSEEGKSTLEMAAHNSNAPPFFVWNGNPKQEVTRKVLTFENAHSEYRDNFKRSEIIGMSKRSEPPKDHEFLQLTPASDEYENNWQSTSHYEMGIAQHSQLMGTLKEPAGLTSEAIAEHLTGRKGPPTLPIYFTWESEAPHKRSDDEVQAGHENVHTESRDSFVPMTNETAKRAPPPPDHNILGNHTPVLYESVAQSQMLSAQEDKNLASDHVAGSTSSLLKKDYRKSYAPGYFAWPVPQQHAEISAESKKNVHTEYRDNFLEKHSESQRAQPPENHNVLGYEDNIDPEVWVSTTKSQEGCASKECKENAAGASSAFLAKDANNLCPPGYFAWPVIPQMAEKKPSMSVPSLSSEYSANFKGVSQVQSIKPPPNDHDVIVSIVDTDPSSQWETVTQSLMQDVKCREDKSDSCLSLEAANRDYRRSYSPHYFAWPVKDQKALRSDNAANNVHTEYRDNFIHALSTSTVRVPPPQDHIEIGMESMADDTCHWKSVAKIQNEQNEADLHRNGQDVVFKDQSIASAPNYFIWPKQEKDESIASAKISRNYGYGKDICSEYDSKFTDFEVQKIYASPIKVTQTIPVNELDPTVWKSTTKSDMESTLLAGQSTNLCVNSPKEMNSGVSDDGDKPMNFAWKPLPEKREKAKETSTKRNSLTTEHRSRFIDWTPNIQALHRDHHVECESNTNTMSSKKGRDTKFGGKSEMMSKYQAWSPIIKRKGVSRSTPLPRNTSSKRTDGTSEINEPKEDASFHDVSHASQSVSVDARNDNIAKEDESNISIATVTTHGESQSLHEKTTDTLGLTKFSADSLDNRSATTASRDSRKWHVTDDLNAFRHTKRLGLRADISDTSRNRPRALSAPTRRRPHNNPILLHSRYPGAVSIHQQSARWSTETSSKYTWK